MADIQVLFTAQTPSGTTFYDLRSGDFFELNGDLFHKLDESNALHVKSDGLELVYIDDSNDFDLEDDTKVVRAPAGVGFTLMQAA